MPPTPRPPAAPLITRRSTLLSGVVLFAALVAGSMLYTASGSGSARGSGALGIAAAVAAGVFVVAAVVVWVSGAVLAARRQSFLWLLVAIMFGPFGSLACALLMDGVAPPPPSGR
jgi:hypothetical protein